MVEVLVVAFEMSVLNCIPRLSTSMGAKNRSPIWLQTWWPIGRPMVNTKYLPPPRANLEERRLNWKISCTALPSWLASIPRNTLFEGNSTAAENIESASNREVNTGTTQSLDMVQILKIPSSSSVCDGDAAPLCQFLHKLLVDSLLKTFVVGGVNEEFRAVFFE